VKLRLVQVLLHVRLQQNGIDGWQGPNRLQLAQG